MIYCAHCSKPSARTDGPCPHCGEDLAAGGAAEQPRPAASEDFSLGPGVQEFELDSTTGDAGGSGLQLASLAPPFAPPPAQPSAASPSGPELQAEGRGEASPGPPIRDSIPSSLRLASLAPPPELRGKVIEETESKEMEVREVAGFGAAAPGLVGAIRYWIQVRQRLAVLRGESERASEELKEAIDYRRIVGAELGRKGAETGLKGKPLISRYAKAHATDALLRDMEGRKSGLLTERETTLNKLITERKKLEQEAEPLRKMDERATRKLNKLKGDYQKIHKQLEVAAKDYESLEAQIAEQQEAYFDTERSEQEREQLFKNSGRMERRKEERIKEIGKLQAQLSAMTDPITAVGKKANEIREQLSERMSRIGDLQRAERGLSKDFTAKEGEVDLEIESASLKVAEAWAEVGESIFKNEIGGAELAPFKEKLMGAIERAVQIEKRVETLAIAKESYDFDVVARAKKIALATSLAVILVLVALIFFMAS